MYLPSGFICLAERSIPELGTLARLLRHEKTGAQVLCIPNDDENKVFGITFRTPPKDSTGVAHILEHSVLCGSRKFPVKEPFVELLKGSLQTFLNAMTYPDKTCYPVASQNSRDLLNLMEVYLDAVFYPRIDRNIFAQEGWHFEPGEGDQLTLQGVVYNEMKGAYSSPENLISEHSQQSLFPDTVYGLDAGGDPARIPDLTFEEFSSFHQQYYHPSNARIFFYGDDDFQARFDMLREYLDGFEPLTVASGIGLQSKFTSPKKITKTFMASSEDGDDRGMVTVNWLLPESLDSELVLSLHILDYLLIGMPASPLRKALIDSGLGEDLVGGGLGDESRQMYYSTGLKGVSRKDVDRVEELILNTLQEISHIGFDPRTVSAGLNTVEFQLRENNTGSFPRGLLVMLRALSTWLYDGDPFGPLMFSEPLGRIKQRIQQGERIFEPLISTWFVDNPHRTFIRLLPDQNHAAQTLIQEQKRIEQFQSTLGPDGRQTIVEESIQLRRLQEASDSEEALATIPRLELSDVPRTHIPIPEAVISPADPFWLEHAIPTNGIVYVDLGFNLHQLPQELLPYIPLVGRALLEMGTQKEDYVHLTQRIRSETGGITSDIVSGGSFIQPRGYAWLFFRGKAVHSNVERLFALFRDVLLLRRMDNQERFRQILLEEKAEIEHDLIPAGHRFVDLRLRAGFSESDWVGEALSGLTQLVFLRKLIERVEHSWNEVLADLNRIADCLLCRNGMVVNVTADQSFLSRSSRALRELIEAIPQKHRDSVSWTLPNFSRCEGLTAPSQVNYVGVGGQLYSRDTVMPGSTMVVGKFLRATWLWERVRVMGGAYGAFCRFDRFTGVVTFFSYRDPNIQITLDVFLKSEDFLRQFHLSKAELDKAIIGAIGEMDRYMLPDAKGFASLVRMLSGESEVLRQAHRDAVLNTTQRDFLAVADVLQGLKQGSVVILGSPQSLSEAQQHGLRFDVLTQAM